MDHKWCKVCSFREVMTAVGKTVCQICKDSEVNLTEEGGCYLIPVFPLWYFMEAEGKDRMESIWISLTSAEEAFKKCNTPQKLDHMRNESIM